MKKVLLSVFVAALLLSTICISAFAAETSGIENNAVYNIINQNSGKYLNVHMGYDVNNTNVYQWTSDGSVEQQFKFVYDAGQDAYRIYAMCSSGGTNKVLDIVKSKDSVVSGCNVQIYNPVDPDAQLWVITKLSNGKYKIAPKSNTAVALTAYGTSNGTSSGTTATSAGNVFVSTYTEATNQQWSLSEIETTSANYGNMGFQYMFVSSYNDTYISSGYKLSNRPSHYAVDLINVSGGAATYGHTINNVYNGKVIIKSLISPSAGKYIVVETDAVDPGTNKKIIVRYLHMSEVNPNISTSSTISTGQYVGKVGNTGDVDPYPHRNDYCNSESADSCQNPNYCATCGTHLHFDANKNGLNSSLTASSAINPQKFFPNIIFTGRTSTLD